MKKFVPIAGTLLLFAVAALAGTGKFKAVSHSNAMRPSMSFLNSMQSAAKRVPQAMTTPRKNSTGATTESYNPNSATVASVGDSIGYTWDDRETFNSMPKRSVYYGGGAAAMVTTGMVTSSDLTNNLGRSIYYASNQGNGAHFVALRTNGKPGWFSISSDQRVHCAMSSLDDGSEAVVADAQVMGPNFPTPTIQARSTTPLEFYVDLGSVLSGNSWVSHTITGSNGGVLPSIAVTDSNVIHVIYAQYITSTDTPEFTEPAYLVYQSSRDTGKTWSTPDTIDANVQVGAYVITSPGPTASGSANKSIAIVYNSLGAIVTIRSSDNGNSWVAHTPWFINGHSKVFKDYPSTTSHDTTIFHTDTVGMWGNMLDAVLTPDNNIHVVSHLISSSIDSVVVNGTFQGYYMRLGNYYYPDDSVGGVIYFNTNDTTVNNGFTLPNIHNIGAAEGDPNGKINLNTLPANTFLTANGNTEGDAFVSQPQLGYQMQGGHPVIYCVYASYNQNDYKVATNNPFSYWIMYSHLYSVSNVGGTWSEPAQLTPDGYDARYPSLAWNADNNFALTFVGDYQPGGLTEASGPIFSPDGPIAEIGWVGPTSALTSVHENKLTPGTFALAQNYPNPVQQTTTFQYSLQNTANVTLNVYDMLGRLVATVANGREDAGIHSAYFNTANLPNGVYTYALQANGKTASNTMVIAR